MIFFSNPQAQYFAHRDEIDAAIKRVQESGYYVLGPEVAAFEKEFSHYCEAAYGIGVNSGTDALTLSLKAFDIGCGDEVISVSHTALATNAAILAAGATPVLVDIDPDYFTIDPDKIEAAISEKTKAIIAVHLYGQPADMEKILAIGAAHGLRVIEDCAQATGARYKGKRVGSLGDVGCFSFYPTKNLGCLGDGGMVVTNNDAIAERIFRLRQYGWNDIRTSSEPGLNSRLDELQAAILRVKLPYLDEENKKRQKIAQRYSNAFDGLPLEVPPIKESCEHVFHLYVARTKARDELIEYLRKNDIGASIHYPVPSHLEEGYQDRLCSSGELPVTCATVKRIITLPIHPELTCGEIEQVIKVAKDYF